MSEALAVKPEESLTLQKVGSGLFKSGLFPNAKNEFGAFAIVQYGAELGIGPMMSLKNINIISGQVACNAQLMLSLAMRQGVTYVVKKETTDGVAIEFRRGEMPPYLAEFDKKDAENAGLVGKDNWKKYPKDMYFWRAVVKGVRRVAPDAVMGLYTADEVSEGKYIDVSDVPPETEKKDSAFAKQAQSFADHTGDQDVDMQKDIGSWLCEMYGGMEGMERELEKISSFTNKQNKVVLGKKNPFDLGVKMNDKGESQTSITHHKVHLLHEDWQKSQEVTDGEVVE